MTKPLTTAYPNTFRNSIQNKPLLLLRQIMIYWHLYVSGLLLSPSSLMKSAVLSALERVWTNCLNAFAFWILDIPVSFHLYNVLFFFVKVYWFKWFYYSVLGWPPGCRSVSGQLTWFYQTMLDTLAMQTCKIEQFLQCGLWKSAGHRKLY